MVQLLFGIGADTSKQYWLNNALRWLFAVFDMVIYFLISVVYQILFTIADSSILSSEYVKAFYDRFQIIIGVTMIFKLAISTLNYVVNPDAISDKKAGAGNMIVRIIGMLAMYTAIMPLSIPSASANSYEAYLNDYGLLFGTMYSLQYRILSTNTIDKLILGTTSGGGTGSQSIKDGGNAFATNLLKTYIRPNTECKSNAVDYDNINTPLELMGYITEGCGSNKFGKDYYDLAYFPVISTVVGAIIIYILVYFCIDVAIRTLKLAILRIIAPVPIISYIDPKSSEKGAFANWIKQIISTFAQLFIILAIIYFAFDIIGRIFDPTTTVLDLPINNGVDSVVNDFATILIILAVLLFARQAPKFIMDVLGIKGTGLIGISGALGGLGAALGGGGLQGLASGSLNAMQDAADAAAQGKAAPPAFSTQRDKMAQMLTGKKDARGGLLGELQGLANDVTNNAASRRMFDIDRNMVGQAKNEMYALQNAAGAAEDRYNRLLNGSMSAEEQNDIMDSNMFRQFLASEAGQAYLNQHGTNAANFRNDLSGDQIQDLLGVALENDKNDKQTAAAKQKAWYEDGAKMLENMGINETLQEKYSSRGRNMRRANVLNRPDDPGYDEPIYRDYARSHQHRGTNPATVVHDRGAVNGGPADQGATPIDQHIYNEPPVGPADPRRPYR